MKNGTKVRAGKSVRELDLGPADIVVAWNRVVGMQIILRCILMS